MTLFAHLFSPPTTTSQCSNLPKTQQPLEPLRTPYHTFPELLSTVKVMRLTLTPVAAAVIIA